MGSLESIVSDLEYGRAQVLQAVAGLSESEATELLVQTAEEGEGVWTVKDILAHLSGWDQRVVDIVPLIAQDRASEILPLEVERENKDFAAAWQDKSWNEALAAIKLSSQQVIQTISGLDYKQVDTRHERQGRQITIRSFVVDTLVEHDRHHAAEIKSWREQVGV